MSFLFIFRIFIKKNLNQVCSVRAKLKIYLFLLISFRYCLKFALLGSELWDSIGGPLCCLVLRVPMLWLPTGKPSRTPVPHSHSSHPGNTHHAGCLYHVNHLVFNRMVYHDHVYVLLVSQQRHVAPSIICVVSATIQPTIGSSVLSVVMPLLLYTSNPWNCLM